MRPVKIHPEIKREFDQFEARIRTASQRLSIAIEPNSAVIELRDKTGRRFTGKGPTLIEAYRAAIESFTNFALDDYQQHRKSQSA